MSLTQAPEGPRTSKELNQALESDLFIFPQLLPLELTISPNWLKTHISSARGMVLGPFFSECPLPWGLQLEQLIAEEVRFNY